MYALSRPTSKNVCPRSTQKYSKDFLDLLDWSTQKRECMQPAYESWSSRKSGCKAEDV